MLHDRPGSCCCCALVLCRQVEVDLLREGVLSKGSKGSKAMVESGGKGPNTSLKCEKNEKCSSQMFAKELGIDAQEMEEWSTSFV
jgi:hypothetical protein